jgi:hypothetical protein
MRRPIESKWVRICRRQLSIENGCPVHGTEHIKKDLETYYENQFYCEFPIILSRSRRPPKFRNAMEAQRYAMELRLGDG